MTVWTQPSLLDLLNPEPTPSPAIDVLYCSQCDESTNATLFNFNHVLMRNGLCLNLFARLNIACAHQPITVETLVSGSTYVTCECGGKFGNLAFLRHAFSAPSTGAFLFGDQNA